MPVFELILDPNGPVLPKPFNIEQTIIDVGNKKYEVHEDLYGKSIFVNCDKRPRDSVLFGIKWIPQNDTEEPNKRS